MSCGLHDVLGFEGQGRPAALVASGAFVQAADEQARLLGAPGLRRIHVAHPIQDRTDEEMAAIATDAVDALLETLQN